MIFERLAASDPGRELATEFMERNGLSFDERLVPRPMRRMEECIGVGYLAETESIGGTMGIETVAA